jgi:D,D-heptose 1,7-bisphosphate phosphatase
MTQAVILAGGKGTRLRERLNGLPKPLIDIGGTPLLEHQVLLAKRCGFDRILVLVSYAADLIERFCAARDNWGIQIECINDGEPLGTAGAVLATFDRLDDEFLVVYGDTMLGVDIARFWKFHKQHREAAATLFLHPNDHPHDSDLVEIAEDGTITMFHPYPHEPGCDYPNLVNAALYVVRKSALTAWHGTPGLLDFGKDVFPQMLRAGMTLFGYNSFEYIKDCGTPSRLDRVVADFASGKIARSALDVAQPCVFLDRDGTINVDIGHLAEPGRFELLPGVGEAISRLNRSDYRAVVVTNQPVLARGECTIDGLRRIHLRMDAALGRSGAYLDRLYYCPHHPDRGFPGEVASLKTVCDCRKPNTGMVDRAVADLNIARPLSWMIGDSTADILLARRAGLRSILLETGAAGLDRKFMVVPDFVEADLKSAVSFVLDQYPRLSALCDDLARKIPARQLVFVGGLSRSGKTTLASALKLALEAKGRTVVVLALDRWLRNANERTSGILGRYDMAELIKLAAMLRDRRQRLDLHLPFYDRMSRTQITGERVVVGPEDVVILEGTIALCLREQLGASSIGYFVQTDEQLRHDRVLREYRLRSLSLAEAEAVYQSRQADEIPIVLASMGKADRCLAMPLPPARSNPIPSFPAQAQPR